MMSYRTYSVVCSLTPLSINSNTFSLSPDSVTPLLFISLNMYVFTTDRGEMTERERECVIMQSQFWKTKLKSNTISQRKKK